MAKSYLGGHTIIRRGRDPLPAQLDRETDASSAQPIAGASVPGERERDLARVAEIEAKQKRVAKEKAKRRRKTWGRNQKRYARVEGEAKAKMRRW